MTKDACYRKCGNSDLIFSNIFCLTLSKVLSFHNLCQKLIQDERWGRCHSCEAWYFAYSYNYRYNCYNNFLLQVVSNQFTWKTLRKDSCQIAGTGTHEVSQTPHQELVSRGWHRCFNKNTSASWLRGITSCMISRLLLALALRWPSQLSARIIPAGNCTLQQTKNKKEQALPFLCPITQPTLTDVCARGNSHLKFKTLTRQHPGSEEENDKKMFLC